MYVTFSYLLQGAIVPNSVCRIGNDCDSKTCLLIFIIVLPRVWRAQRRFLQAEVRNVKLDFKQIPQAKIHTDLKEPTFFADICPHTIIRSQKYSDSRVLQLTRGLPQLDTDRLRRKLNQFQMSSSDQQSNCSADSQLDFGDEAVYTPEERALRIITKDFTLNLNQKDVVTRIKDHPMLHVLERARLIQLKRNAKKKMNRQKAKGQRKSHPQSNESSKLVKVQQINEDKSAQKVVRQDAKPEDSENSICNPECGPSSVTTRKMRERVIDILREAIQHDDDHHLMKAVVTCIVRPNERSNPELESLLSLKAQLQAEKLNELVKSGSFREIQECSERTESHLVLKAFIDAASEDACALSDQQVISDVVLTAINRAQEFPNVGVKEIRGAYRVLDACSTLLVDLDKVPEAGYFVFAHKLQMLNKSYTPFKDEKRVKNTLQAALTRMGISNTVAGMLCKDCDKFIYSDFVEKMSTLSTEEQKSIVKILSKLKPGFDPTSDVQDLQRVFKSRLMLRECLVAREGNIDMTASELLCVIKAFVENNTEKSAIKRILALDSACWMDQIKLLQSSIENGRPITDEQGDRIYKRSKQEINRDLWTVLIKLSQTLAEKCENYQGNILQVYIVAKIITGHSKATASLIPTGTGKTFICTLLQMYYKAQGQRVALVTSQQYLVDQAETMLGSYRQEVDVLTMQEALKKRHEYTMFIIDEADECICSYGVLTDEITGTVTGFWDLVQKHTILLTATVKKEMEEILYRIFSIKISEYKDFTKVIKDLSPTTCTSSIRFVVKRSESEQESEILKVIEEQYQLKPLLVFVQGPKLVGKIKSACGKIGVTPIVIMNDDDIAQQKLKMRSMDRAIAVVNRRYARGTDFRFNQDSLVIGTCMPENMQDAVQMAGRSSRTMKHHDCVIIVEHQHLDERTIVEHLNLTKIAAIKEGIKAVKILVGKHATGDWDDKRVIKHFSKSWITMPFFLITKYTKEEIVKFEKLADEFITASKTQTAATSKDANK